MNPNSLENQTDENLPPPCHICKCNCDRPCNDVTIFPHVSHGHNDGINECSFHALCSDCYQVTCSACLVQYSKSKKRPKCSECASIIRRCKTCAWKKFDQGAPKCEECEALDAKIPAPPPCHLCGCTCDRPCNTPDVFPHYAHGWVNDNCDTDLWNHGCFIHAMCSRCYQATCDRCLVRYPDTRKNKCSICHAYIQRDVETIRIFELVRPHYWQEHPLNQIPPFG